MEFIPTEHIATAADFDETQTNFITHKTYFQAYHQTQSKLITPTDEEFIFDL